jgi:hypothetical protein
MIPRLPIAAAALMLAACAARPLPPLPPDRVAVAGDTATFGPGLRALSSDGRHATVELRTSARGFFFNVHASGWVELLETQPLGATRATVRLPLTVFDRRAESLQSDPFTPVRSSSLNNDRLRSDNPDAHRREMLLLVVVDPAIDPTQQRMEDFQQFRLTSVSLAHQAVPMMMFGTRYRWAAYIVN